MKDEHVDNAFSYLFIRAISLKPSLGSLSLHQPKAIPNSKLSCSETSCYGADAT